MATLSPEEQAELLLGVIEAMNQMADLIDSFKTSLESRGWSTPAAEQAATVIVGPVLAALMVQSATTPKGK